MLDLKQKLAAAKKDYEVARINLEKVRTAYNDGPQKEYAETQANLAELRATIKGNEAALEESKASLAKELQRSNGKTTEAAKKILSDRRSIDDVLDQCQVILQEVEKRASDLHIPVSQAAQEYQHAYSKATHYWWKVNTYSVLQECGQKMCEAMAVVPFASTDQFSAGFSTEDKYPSRTLILKELDRMLAEYKGSPQPYRAELGDCNLGALREVLTPGQITARRNGLKVSA